MTNDHATYFGQSQPHTLPKGDGGTVSMGSQNNPTTVDTTLTPIGVEQQGGHTNSSNP